MAETQEILACPFCDQECVEKRTTPDDAMVVCDTCGYTSGAEGTARQAIAAHNKVSHNNAAADDMLDALREVEWMGGAYTECPLCEGGSMKDIHEDWCKIGIAIAKGENHV